MKIGLIRHYPVKVPFLEGFASQSEVIDWFYKYDNTSVQDLGIKIEEEWDICYSSTMRRSRETAKHLFEKEILYSDLLNEPSPDPIFEKNMRLPFLLWALIFRAAITLSHSSQSQGKKKVLRNLEAFLEQIEQYNSQVNVLIIGHSFTMSFLSDLLIKRGFKGSRIYRPKHGALFLFTR